MNQREAEAAISRELDNEIDGLVRTIGRRLRKQVLAESAVSRKNQRMRIASRERIRRAFAQCQSEIMLRIALFHEIPMSEILKTALRDFNGQEDVLRDFVRDLVFAMDSGKSTPRIPEVRVPMPTLVRWWYGFVFFPRNQEEATVQAAMPPLSRWNGKAALQFLRTFPYEEPGLDYRTHRKRISRWGLYQIKPILVRKMTIIPPKISPPNFIIIYTPAGIEWLREKDLLGAVTRISQNMSHDNLTKLRINTVGEKTGTHLARSRNRRTCST
jgi:hypothetical protein